MQDIDELHSALVAMDAMLKSGMSFESALQQIASSNYGNVSKEFSRALEEARTVGIGGAMQNLVDRNRKNVLGEVMFELVQNLGTGNLNVVIERMSKNMLEKKKVSNKGVVEKMYGAGNVYLVFAAILPICVISAYGAFDILKDFPFFEGIATFSILIDLLLYFNLVALIAILIYVKILGGK
ncbi:MAG: type II secretion system F family protein [Candidatus Parvarchaeota archaeon]|nr:type II secretion system F family protein [Candidatus Jingweiarchaeum tengchongense]MCW1298611.1 type II secretion system F family protein [Candidatus Jingweiarchaeum tengchongense]MCW1300457.1 type II secretion system F family protein [Candidatus Jingweiarchaeum tengchongense]MCW1304953.1 type II secretion system F family protein [Candidatus Jingweiarchaeum tengchongense]MCW1305487.1 type II secretion system F family protein [Candidatus Jingweiarchaeum tengchongense]